MRISYMFFLLILLLPAPAAWAEPTTDPWAKVPTLPTNCYREDDWFDSSAQNTQDALRSQESQQQEINLAVDQQDGGEIDPMAMQQRMLTLLSEHPEDAQRIIEAMTQGGQQVAGEVPELQERTIQFDADLQELKAAYALDLGQAIEPIDAQRQRVNASLAETCNAELVAKVAELNAAENRAYGGICTHWWASGPFHEWLVRFRQFKIEEAALWAEHAETIKLQYELMGKSAGQYRSTEGLKGAIDYLRLAREVFNQRRHAPVDEAPGSCLSGHG